MSARRYNFCDRLVGRLTSETSKGLCGQEVAWAQLSFAVRAVTAWTEATRRVDNV